MKDFIDHINMDGLYNIDIIGQSLPDVAGLFIEKGVSQFKYVENCPYNQEIYQANVNDINVIAKYTYTKDKYHHDSIIDNATYTITSSKYSEQDWINTYNSIKNRLIGMYCYNIKDENNEYHCFWRRGVKILDLRLHQNLDSEKIKIEIIMKYNVEN